VPGNFLPIAFKNAGLLLEEALPVVLQSSPKLRSYEFICLQYRRLAVGSLLMSAEPTDFFSYLSCSARAFLHFLGAAPQEEKLTSRSTAFFDALACRDSDAIAGIATSSPREANTKREYEEDFLHLRVAMDLATTAADATELQALVDAYAAAAAGQDDPALPVCQALVGGQTDDVVRAIRAGAASRQSQLREQLLADQLDADDAPTTARVSTEVLGWIELAARRGVEIRGEVPLAPSVARIFDALPPIDPNAWTTCASFRQLRGPSE